MKHDPVEIGAQCRGKERRKEAVFCNRRTDGGDAWSKMQNVPITITIWIPCCVTHPLSTPVHFELTEAFTYFFTTTNDIRTT